MKDKIKVFGILAILMLAIYYVATTGREKELENIAYINKDFKVTNGIVVRKSVQKGNHLWVKYNVNGVEYNKSDGFTESQKFSIGDTIKIKFSKTRPDLMITQFNEHF